MILIGHICVPQGTPMHETLSRFMNEVVKPDNRRVIAAMLRNGQDVPDTVGELGLPYVPEVHETDDEGEPIIHVYGLAQMIRRKKFSCGDAACFEAAILEEKYGIATSCLSVPQGDDDAHAMFVTKDLVVDPTANFLQGRRYVVKGAPLSTPPTACSIEDGRVVCEEPISCGIDSRGIWSCPDVPGLSGRREAITSVHSSARGGSWARTPNGAVVPVRARRRLL